MLSCLNRKVEAADEFQLTVQISCGRSWDGVPQGSDVLFVSQSSQWFGTKLSDWLQEA